MSETAPTKGAGARTSPSHWATAWRASVPQPAGRRMRRPDVLLGRVLAEALAARKPRGKTLLEVGCGNSHWLPVLVAHHGLSVAGIDYTSEGCQTARANLEAAGVHGHIVEADVFDPPADLLARFDYVWSYGFLEHFDDTDLAVVSAARFLAPGGLMISVVPNMTGFMGFLQRRAERSIFDLHVPLDHTDLAEAHRAAGLDVLAARFILPTSFLVLNFGARERSALRPLIAGAKIAASLPFWTLDRIGLWPANSVTSPYVFCLARKPG